MTMPDADAGLTRRFVDVLADWPAESAELEARCRLLLLDGLAVAAAGARERGPSLMAELVRAEGGAGPATVIGQDFATSPVAAARVNGMAMHVLDFEPMWNPPNHALSPLLPALLALVERRECDGAGPPGPALLRGIARGVEAQGRLRLASGQIEPAKNAYHPSGVVGPVATALACASLLGLDRAATVMAVGIAASRTGGLLANVGSMTKALHCGDAAAHGLEVALLAARGFTADPDALGSPRGWGKSLFGADFDPAPLLLLVSVPRALAPGPSWKLFPSQFATHFAITAALEARAVIGGKRISERVRRIELRTPAMP
jgi:2-methylcitrate dehydratase PrpD